MAAIDNFDPDQVPPSTGFDAIPPGKYQAVIIESEQKETSKKNGHYLNLTFEIIEGEFEKRKVWARLNLDNPSDVAVGIARAELSAICRAVGHQGKLVDSTQLHDLPLTIRVIKKKDQQTGEDRNEIKGYEPTGGTPAVKSTVATTTAPAKTGAGAPAPWTRKKK